MLTKGEGGFLWGGGFCVTIEVFPDPHAELEGPLKGSAAVWTLTQNKGPSCLPAVGSAAVDLPGCS